MMIHLAIIEDVTTEAGIVMAIGFLGMVALLPLAIALLFKKLRRVSFWLLCLDIIGLVFLGFVSPLVSGYKTKHPSAACVNNLLQISAAYRIYQMDHDSHHPDSFADLREYIDTPRCFICPRTQEPGDISNVADWTPYVLRSSVTNNHDILLYCSNTEHYGLEGTHVVFVDGNRRWITPEELTALLANPEKAQQHN